MKKIGNLVCQFLLRHRKKLIIMRNTLLIVLISSLQVFAVDSYAQTKKINLDLKDATIKEVLYAIEKQSEFYFLFNSELIDVSKKVDITVQEEKVADILIRLFKNSDIDFLVKDRYIVLTPGDKSSGDTFNLLVQQQGTVSGRVTDKNDQPLPGVTVVVKGTTQGTITDTNGEYTLTNLPSGATLVFSFVGMRTQEMIVGQQVRINVVMEEETIGLEEVVAIGYGTQKKKNITGAVDMITSESLEDRGITSIGKALQGVISNLNISIPSGEPSTKAIYNIRGFESITGGNPLIVVDGVPMGDLNDVNPNQIAEISVLKDAGSAAIYGARGAFGIILIETKNAKERKFSVDFSMEHSTEKPIWLTDPLDNPYEYGLQMNEAYLANNAQPLFNERQLEGAKKWWENPIPENAWIVDGTILKYVGNAYHQNRLLRDFIPKHNYSLSVSGTAEKFKYYTSVDMRHDEGVTKFKPEKVDRLNFLIKTEFSPSDWFNLRQKISFNHSLIDKPHASRSYSDMVDKHGPMIPPEFPNPKIFEDQLTEELRNKHDYSKYEGMWIYERTFAPYHLLGARD
ncbi:MAG: TonB-dependent receptor plug domain-containing protein, partial [Clostridiales bacterium]|nr:TonB-dependent receptor plug domain-containing protein [Clostridiales bacterium]